MLREPDITIDQLAVTTYRRPRPATAPPDDVLANVNHILAIQRKIDTLRAAQKDAVGALEASARRWHSPIDDLLALRAQLKAADAPGRSALNMSSGPDHTQGCASKWSRFPAVYLLIRAGTVVYVGRTGNPRNRIKQHVRDKNFDSVEIHECETHEAAVHLEAILQQQHQPQYNRRIEQRPV